MNRKLLASVLENHGHHCDQAADGPEAIEKVQRAETFYDTILMDYEIPVCSTSPEAAQQIRSMGCDTFMVENLCRKYWLAKALQFIGSRGFMDRVWRRWQCTVAFAV